MKISRETLGWRDPLADRQHFFVRGETSAAQCESGALHDGD